MSYFYLEMSLASEKINEKLLFMKFCMSQNILFYSRTEYVVFIQKYVYMYLSESNKVLPSGVQNNASGWQKMIWQDFRCKSGTLLAKSKISSSSSNSMPDTHLP